MDKISTVLIFNHKIWVINSIFILEKRKENYDIISTIIIITLIIVVLRLHIMPALTWLTRVSTQAWLDILPTFPLPSSKWEESVAQLDNQYRVPASLPFGNWSKHFYTGYTSCHKLILTRLVEHVEVMNMVSLL